MSHLTPTIGATAFKFRKTYRDSGADSFVKILWSYLASFWHGSRVWWTDTQTHMP